jgi:hypothetical protein
MSDVSDMEPEKSDPESDLDSIEPDDAEPGKDNEIENAADENEGNKSSKSIR